MTKVLILGGTGMLGHAVLNQLQKTDMEVLSTSRAGEGLFFDAANDAIESIGVNLFPSDYIINCLGITKPHIDEDCLDSRALAIQVNSLFPAELARFAQNSGVRVIQIATDCVYSGRDGGYLESDQHDAGDVYGKTKSLGEVDSPNVMHIRSSTIGRELGRSTLLLEWVLSHPLGATIPGYTDHFWNGVTTNHFAKIARGIIESGRFTPGISHLVPADSMSKAELVKQIARAFGRDDLNVIDTDSGRPVNRTLRTVDPEFNRSLWVGAGYHEVPIIEQLIAEIAG